MERVPAFKPKINKESEVEVAQEKKELPLKRLEEDSAEVSGFNYALDLVLQGLFTERFQVDALVDPRFDRDGILIDLNGGRVSFSKQTARGSRISRFDLQEQKLTAEGAETLKDILKEKISAEKNKEQADAEVSGFNYALDLVLQGLFTERSQVDALVDPRFDRDGILIDLNGGRVSFSRQASFASRISKFDLQERKLTVEGAEIIKNILKEKISAEKNKEQADAEVSGFNYALDLVLQGLFTERSQVDALVDPRFDRDGILIDLNGGRVSFSKQTARGSRISRFDLQEQKLTGEGGEIINRLIGLLSSESFPEEIKKNLQKFVSTKDPKTLERLDTIMEVSADSKIQTDVSSLVADILSIERVSILKKDIYGGIVNNKPNQQLLSRLGEFDEKSPSDRQLVAKLQGEISAKNKREIIEKTRKKLTPKPDVDAISSQLQPLLNSQRRDDLEAALFLLKLGYRSELANLRFAVSQRVNSNPDTEAIRNMIDAVPTRPSIGEIDYVKEIVEIRERAFKNISDILKVKRLEKVCSIRQSFGRLLVPKVVLMNIDMLPSETKEDVSIKSQLLDLYRSFLAANRPELFDEQYAKEIRERQQRELKDSFVNPELGKNKQAFNYVRQRFLETIFPLVETLRADPTTAPVVKKFLEAKGNSKDDENPKNKFEQRMQTLEEQRPLTDVERTYLQSVELISLFNPYIVSSAYADPGLTIEFLRHHFEQLSRRTIDELKDGDYVPLLQIGLGPNGLAAIGETVRNNASLAEKMLVVDAGKQPGGPFAIPEGAAWELNSANRRGKEGRILPQKPEDGELKTIRAYGSPLRWYPGERTKDKTVRQGSINVTVDYLPTPDDLSTARYPTNEELQLILALQAAVLAKRVALQTRVVGVEKNPDPHAKGDKIVTLEIANEDGENKKLKIATDAIFVATGLGEPGYGFSLKGSKAEKVLKKTKGEKGFPKISRTLEAFNAFAGRSNEEIIPGETLVIYGKGNSADTLIEYIGNIFQGDNPLVRNVSKIYVVSEGDLSSRPRYALINDLKPRNGKGNLIEQVNARVADIDFARQKKGDGKDKLVVFDPSGNVIVDGSGKPILADNVIAATGFRSELDEIFRKYTGEGGKKSEKKEIKRTPLSLPTNPSVSVAETLEADPSILILGTASKPEFDSVDKLGQLPREAREALLRNGAENAVAIGFRAPDTQAAVNIWLNSKDINLETGASQRRRIIQLSGDDSISPGLETPLQISISPEDIKIPNNVESETRFLSSLLAYSVGNAIQLEGEGGFLPNKLEFNFSLEYDRESDRYNLEYRGGSTQNLSRGILEALIDTCLDTDFQKYALRALSKKRRNPTLSLTVGFQNGFVNPRETFVQD